jgi:hypothetical protein
MKYEQRKMATAPFFFVEEKREKVQERNGSYSLLVIILTHLLTRILWAKTSDFKPQISKFSWFLRSSMGSFN